MTDPPWLAACARPTTFDAAPAGARVERVETHISWVFLVGEGVWKFKKPVDFGFLDFTTVERRLAACEAEVALNKRLAPDVYLGVEAVCRRPDGGWHVGVPAPGDEVVDHAVRMRRLPDTTRADERLRAGTLGFEEVERVAGRLAAFHAGCRRDAASDRLGSVEGVAENVRENLWQSREILSAVLDPDAAEEVVANQVRFLETAGGRLRARVAAGRVRDGHGDLRLEHVYLDPGGEVRVLDCIEFNERFRYADVAADLAFLAMDLTAHGRDDLAEHLLAAYAREADDYDLYGVIDFYEAYRAWVRAKVSGFCALDPDAAPSVRGRALDAARRYFLVARGTGRARLVAPLLVAVGGPVASGKSTVAAALARGLGAPVVEADRTRKGLAGVGPTERLGDTPWAGAYDPGFTERVYAELERRAGVVLASGRPVVLDATFRTAALRARARAVADAAGVPFFFLECAAPRVVLEARLRAREHEPGQVSDARLPLLDEFLRAWEPVTELTPGLHRRLATDRPLAEVLAEARDVLPQWPAGLVG